MSRKGHNKRRRDHRELKPVAEQLGSPRELGGVCAALVLLVLAVFGQTVFFQFVSYDDQQYVAQNATVNAGLTAKGLAWAFTSVHANNWHPLTWLSHMLDCQLFGLSSGWHHLVNVLFHAANAVILFLVLRQMTRVIWPSALAAAVFAVHPLRVESVAWVAERKDVLSLFFFLLTIAAYLQYVKKGFSWPRYLTISGLFALALMAKPMVVTLPFVLLLLDYWPLGRLLKPFGAEEKISFRRRLQWPVVLEKVPLMALSAGSCLMTLGAQRELIAAEEQLSLFMRIANAAVSYATYIGQVFLPIDLAVFYPHWGRRLPMSYAFWSFLVLAVISGAALAWRNRYPYLVVGWLWYLGTLVPVIGLVQVGAQGMADRYTYLPQIGLYVAMIWLVHDLGRTWWLPRRAWIAGSSVIAILAILAFTQTTHWQNSESLWRRTVACTKPNPIGLANLGLALADVHKFDEAMDYCRRAHQFRGLCPAVCATLCRDVGIRLRAAGRLEQAAEVFRMTVELTPQEAEPYYNLGEVLRQLGRTDEAIRCLRESLCLKPDSADAINDLGAALARRGEIDEGMQLFAKAIELKPDCYEAYNNRGAVLAAQGKLAEAIEQYYRSLSLNPNYAEAHNNLGFALSGQGKLAEATGHYRQALEAMPEYAKARYNLADVLMRQNRFAEAIVEWKVMVDAFPTDPVLLNHLAIAYASAGDTVAARAMAGQALEIARQQQNAPLAQAIEAKLQTWSQGK